MGSDAQTDRHPAPAGYRNSSPELENVGTGDYSGFDQVRIPLLVGQVFELGGSLTPPVAANPTVPATHPLQARADQAIALMWQRLQRKRAVPGLPPQPRPRYYSI